LVAADLLGFGRGYHPVLPLSDIATAPRWLSARMTEPGGWRTTVLDRRSPEALDDELLTASMGLPLGTSDVLIPSPLLMVRNDAYLAAVGLDVGDKGDAKVSRWLAHHDLARRLGVRFVASIHEIPDLLPLVRGVWNVYEDQSALPRARIVPCAVVVADADAAYAAVLREDPEQTVVIEDPGGARVLPGCMPAAATSDQRRDVEVLDYQDHRVSVRATGPGWLVLADTWYPGWTASVDGVTAPVERADLLMRAVRLQAGEHEVEFAYRAGVLGWLLGASGLSALGCLALGLRGAVPPEATRRAWGLDPGGADFFGVELPQGATYDIGAHERP
jgi:hypothetical protein